MTVTIDRRTVLGAALGLVAIGALPGVAACSTSSSAAPGDGLENLSVDAARVALRSSAVPSVPEVVAGLTGFGAALHRQAGTDQATWTVSPLSIAVAFGMLRAGAAGSTATQLDEVFGWTDGAPHEALNALTADLVTDGPVDPGPSPADGRPAPPVVAVANGLFLDRTFAPQVRQEFLRVLAEQYGARAAAVSFADPSAAATINTWVQEQTRGRIEKLFDRLDPSTLAVLANAVYLKAAWAAPFEPSMTEDGAFRAPAGSTTVPLMHQQGLHTAYDESDGAQRLVLPYVGGELALHLVLPRDVRDGAGLSALVPSLTTKIRGAAVVDLTLPRWAAATNLPLLPTLHDLGLTSLGDLSGIAPGALSVSDAVHRADVTVDEAGTEAAAVTGVAVDTSASVGRPVEVRVDRPFVWAVVHEPTRTPVFLGHVVDPST